MIKLDRKNNTLTMSHTTEDGYVGTLVVPTDRFTLHALEQVHSPKGLMIHNTTFPAKDLGEATDLEPYLVGMTRSARNRWRRVS